MRVSEAEPTRIIIEITDLSNTMARKAKPITEYKDGLKTFPRDFYVHYGSWDYYDWGYSNTSFHVMWDY